MSSGTSEGDCTGVDASRILGGGGEEGGSIQLVDGFGEGVLGGANVDSSCKSGK